MKINEAPEKLYLHPTAKGNVGASWLTFPLTNEDIEYVRYDAFVEKACGFINKANLYLYHCISEECGLVDTDKMIEDFRKYLEGE